MQTTKLLEIPFFKVCTHIALQHGDRLSLMERSLFDH
jgi:hypothetical protein